MESFHELGTKLNQNEKVSWAPAFISTFCLSMPFDQMPHTADITLPSNDGMYPVTGSQIPPFSLRLLPLFERKQLLLGPYIWMVGPYLVEVFEKDLEVCPCWKRFVTGLQVGLWCFKGPGLFQLALTASCLWIRGKHSNPVTAIVLPVSCNFPWHDAHRFYLSNTVSLKQTHFL